MEKEFSFVKVKPFEDDAKEANIFIHGYSAGFNINDRRKLLRNVPPVIGNYANILALWPSSHFARMNAKSKGAVILANRLAFVAAPLASIALTPMVLLADRAMHFSHIRSRAERMGEQLIGQLSSYLSTHCPKIQSVNLIGHSLGGRLIISCLKTFNGMTGHRFSINDVLLMAAAVEVQPIDAQRMRQCLKGRLINAYSTADFALLMNARETCLGRNQVEHFENFEMYKFGHSDYWKNLAHVLNRTKFKSYSESPSSFMPSL